jgi:hypothetical protein
VADDTPITGSGQVKVEPRIRWYQLSEDRRGCVGTVELGLSTGKLKTQAVSEGPRPPTSARTESYCSGCATTGGVHADARGGNSISPVNADSELGSICTDTASVPADAPRSTPRVGAASP